MKKVLVTGASGFIGSFIVSEGLERGYDVWAGVRETSSRAYLTDSRINFAQLSLNNKQKLVDQLYSFKSMMGGCGWDYVVHAAGATKCRDMEEFYRTNTHGTANLVEALQETGMVPECFVFISSLSVYGAIREKQVRAVPRGYARGACISEDESVYDPIMLTDDPAPNTAYGMSKLSAEYYLEKQDPDDFPYVILRPTGVYGPREKDYFVMAKSIAGHTDFAVGFRPQELTFVYVDDVVQAVYKSMTSAAACGNCYFLSDGRIYNSRRFSDLIRQELGNPWLLRLRIPKWVLRVICKIGGKIGRMTGRLIVLNDDKYNILAQRNWRCDIEPARQDFDYAPEWPLERGVKAAMDWYKREGWL
ncbi:MAG: NAD(P)-dependent oxidoreductase [Bacteroidaceae bacterium]|nr:NAD(P)-dependent oxidoreductase [Bacteroidaceae bacterium]